MALTFRLPEPEKLEIKPDFSELPPAVLEKIETCIGDKITTAHTAYGGYSSAFSALVKTTGKQGYFIKGTHPDEMSHGAKTLAQEIYIYQNAEILSRIAPELIGAVEHGDEDEWRLGIWREIPNAGIKTRWTEGDFQSFAQAMRHLYTESGHKIPAGEDVNFIKDIISGQNSWRKFYDNEARQQHFINMFADPLAAQNRLTTTLDRLITLSRSSVNHIRGLAHFDMRSDNILFDRTGRCFIIDWPNGCIAPLGYDLVNMACELAARGNGDAQAIFARLCAMLNIDIPADDVKAILAKLSGYYALNAYRPIPEKLPRLRWMQKALLHMSYHWLASMDGFETLPKLKKIGG